MKVGVSALLMLLTIAGDFWVYRRVCPRALKLLWCLTLLSVGLKFTCVHGNVFNEVLLEEPLKVTRNFKDAHWQIEVEYDMRTCQESAFELLQNEMEVFNTFNVDAWCGVCNDTEDWVEEFWWHNFRSCLNNRYHLDEMSCPQNSKECSTIVAWIEPVWVHPSADLSWML